ncbi:hypothetical protein VCCP103710_2515, partial [Vibrio cholerae CP1037(10)]
MIEGVWGFSKGFIQSGIFNFNIQF